MCVSFVIKIMQTRSMEGNPTKNPVTVRFFPAQGSIGWWSFPWPTHPGERSLEPMFLLTFDDEIHHLSKNAVKHTICCFIHSFFSSHLQVANLSDIKLPGSLSLQAMVQQISGVFLGGCHAPQEQELIFTFKNHCSPLTQGKHMRSQKKEFVPT